MNKLNVAVIFGSRSVEHDVSIITGIQVIQNLNPDKYNVIPIYITKTGKWLTGDYLKTIVNYKDKNLLVRKTKNVDLNKLNFDVVIPAVHGTNGEDGTLQGLLEIFNIPYVGAGVVGSAVGMDKIIQKAVFKENDIPVANYVWFNSSNVKINEVKLKYPLYIKPANLGSSIGITKATDRKSLEFAIEVASHYDRRILIEEAVPNCTEINCSVLGNENPLPSILEEPIRYDEILSFKDKYLRGEKSGKGSKGMASLSRRIPAPISEKLTKKIKDLAVAAYKAVDCSGIARIDFLLDKKTEKVYVNEINTIPGSFSFYLWEKSGYPFPQLLDRLIGLALERHAQKQGNIYSYDTELLAKVKLAGSKK